MGNDIAGDTGQPDKITIVETDNWVLVFKGNDIVSTGHDIQVEYFLEALGHVVEAYWVDGFDDEIGMDGAEWFDTLDQIPDGVLE